MLNLGTNKSGAVTTVALSLLVALAPALGAAQSAQDPPPLKPGQIRIRVVNAQTNQPVTNERLNVALRDDQVGSVAMGTDKTGVILVDTKKGSILRILANMYADCRPREELYTNYSVATIISTGITTGNLCSSASPVAKPGELILYEVPKTYLRQYPAPPVDSMPHHPN
ncbi:hypothetical protein [Tunturiibacter gelidoferens]|jgi:hypothetical protein|uniref:Uncharacterized protein n=1 Tax=Tunturiibacter gelidiferens TaxID=3069689 RepID=A0A9X0U4C9_9BACT|nr:hypothetical protein [Edaphobacter lichenicola]MBB5327727.1 hypothetical protein [Edaphobacter lichenicola]